MLGSKRIIGLVVIVAVVVTVFVFSLRIGGEETEVWWIGSDPHVRGPEGLHLRIAIQDVNELGIADRAAILGDIVHNSDEYADDFLQIMDNLKVEKWYYVLGNHDHDETSGENVFPIFYGGVDALGIRFIFISDEVGWEDGEQIFGGVMREDQYEWLWMELFNRKDQPVFIFSHQKYNQWNVWPELASSLEEGTFNLKAWFYGHLHRWTISENIVEPYGFIEVGASSLDWAGNYHGIFIFLKRRGDTTEVTIKFRDHLNREWISVETVDDGVVENISFSVKLQE
jgi:calcineurin-like phosphoesterase family protein